MLAFHSQRHLEAAAAPALERIRQDRSRAPVRIKPLLAFIEENLFDPALDVNHLKRSCGVRDNSVPLLFHSVLGRPPHGYIEDRRLETAKSLLSDSDLKVWKIADLLGYSSIQVFSRAFARWSGERPTAFRKRNREKRHAVQPQFEGGTGIRRQVNDPAFLRRALAGQLSTREASQLIDQLMMLYPISQDSGAPGSPSVGQAQDFMGTPDAGIGSLNVDEIWNLLEARPWSQQRSFVRNHLRLNDSELFRYLRARSLETGRNNPERGVEIARLALDSIEAVEPGSLSEMELSRLKAHGIIWLGDSLRVASDFPGLAEAIHQAEALSATHGDRLLTGDLLKLKATLSRAQSRYQEALDMIDEYEALYRSLDRTDLIVKALIHRSITLKMMGEPKAALGPLREAMALLDTLDEPYLTLAATFNRVVCCVDAGEMAEAEGLLPTARALCKRDGQKGPLARLTWLEARMATEDSRPEDAEKLFQAAREAFLELGNPYDASLACLDLAALYAQTGNRQELQALCVQMVPLFQSLQLHREAMVALNIFTQAVSSNEVSTAILSQLKSLLVEFRDGDLETIPAI